MLSVQAETEKIAHRVPRNRQDDVESREADDLSDGCSLAEKFQGDCLNDDRKDKVNDEVKTHLMPPFG